MAWTSALRALAGRGAADPLAGCAAQLPPGPNRTVVVVAPDGGAPRHWLRPFRGDDVHVLKGTPRPGDIVAGLGQVDVIVDVRRAPGKEREQLWRQLFLHLRPGGSYVVGEAAERAATWLRRYREAETFDSPLETELAGAIARVTRRPHLAIVRKRNQHLLKLREHALPQVLPRREPQISYVDIETIPAGSYTTAARTYHHGPLAPTEWIGERIDYPAMRLRRYSGRLAFGGRMLVHGEQTILPDSFSWPLSPDGENPRAISAGPEFARVPPARRPQRELDGNFYLLDSNYSGFGHVMTEVVGRLWAWDRAKAEVPDLKALLWAPNAEQVDRRDPMFRIPEAYGIPAEDIVCLDRPAYLHSLVAPSLMWHNRQPYYSHPQLTTVWERIGDTLIDRGAQTYERVFIARSPDYKRRACRNDLDVQKFFAERGFTVVYPELLDLGTQAAVFAGAKVIAGYGGSGLFNVAFARDLQTLIVLNHHSYTARNEQLFAAVLGVAIHYFWSEADISHPPGRRTMEAVESPWEFDFAHNGGELDEVLAAL